MKANAISVIELIDAVIAREGGYVDHPADRGGPTRWGITEAVARTCGYTGNMRHMPREQAEQIYRALYWDGPKLCAIGARAPRLAAEMFDTAVNMGPGTAIAFLQRALNALNRGGQDFADIAVDKSIGPATLQALDCFLATRTPAGERVLIRAIDALQGERYIALAESRPANEAFVYGWIANRID